MKIFKYLFFILLICFIGGAIFIATLNSTYKVERTRVINAPTEVVFENINEYRNWQGWSPWYEKDSTMVSSFPEKTSGIGASYSWTGKDGNGTIKTISVIPNKQIIQQLDFNSGSLPTVNWSFNPIENGTKVSWEMTGKNSFPEKIYWLFKGGAEKNMNPIFDRGLELLDKKIARDLEKHSFEIKGLSMFGGGYYLYQSTSCKIQDMGDKLPVMFGEIQKYMAENNLESSGKPYAIFHKWDEDNRSTMFSACIPVNEKIITSGNVLNGYLEPQKTFKLVFKGDYKFSEDAWKTTYEAISSLGFEAIENVEPFEVYKVSPNETANPSKWVTEIFIPVK